MASEVIDDLDLIDAMFQRGDEEMAQPVEPTSDDAMKQEDPLEDGTEKDGSLPTSSEHATPTKKKTKILPDGWEKTLWHLLSYSMRPDQRR